MSKLSENLDRLIREKNSNRKAVALAAGLTPTTVQYIVNGKTKSPSIDTLARIAKVLGTTPAALTGGEYEDELPVDWIPVAGEIQAGALRSEHEIFKAVSDKKIPAAYDSRFPNAPRFAFEVLDDSADQIYPKGAKIVCVRLKDMPGLEDGRRYVLHHYDKIMQKFEARIWEYSRREGGREFFVSRTNNPEFQSSIEVKTDGGDYIIFAAVVGSYITE